MDTVLETVRGRVGAAAYEAWFRGLRGGLDGDRVVVYCPDRFSLNWIRGRYGEVLAEACGGSDSVVLRIDPRGGEPAVTAGPTPSSPVAPTAPAPAVLEPSLESFVAGAANALALEAARAIARGQGGRCSPLLITGSSGLGKSHLLRGIRSELVASRRSGVVYRSSEEFTTEVTEAMRGGRMGEVRARYRRSANVLILEDLQFLEGKRATQIELFHTLDHLLRHGRTVVASADRAPQELSGLDPGLRSRLCSGLVAVLSPPEEETRRRILRAKANAGGVRIPDACVELLAQRPAESVRDLLAALNQVVARASLLRAPVTPELVREALSAVAAPGPRRNLDQILELVSRAYAVPLELLRGRSRRRNVVRPRQIAMYLCRLYTDASLKQIGDALGRDHTSVLYAIEALEKRILEQPQLRYELEALAAQLRLRR